MSISACIEARAGWRYGEAPRHWTWRGVGTDRCGGAGHHRIAIGGHSGGAVRATYAQATERFDNVAAVIAVSPGEYDHEGVTALHGESFSGPFRESERNIAEGQPDVLLRPGIPWGSTWSARAYVDCFNRDNRYSVTTHAANTGCPTLYVFGAEESAVGGPQEIPVVGAKHVWMGLGNSAASNPSTHLPDTSTPLGCRAHVCLVGPVSPSEQGL